MLEALLPSFRNLRSSLLTGSLIVGSLYILFGYNILAGVSIKPAAKEILNSAPFMPQILFAVFAYVVGSLYITGLEGMVDWLHRTTSTKTAFDLDHSFKQWLLRRAMPLSDASRARIDGEAARFYREHASAVSDHAKLPTEAEFVSAVIGEILWMEGKLAGTVLATPYDQYRSEGELRLGLGLILPLIAAAIADAAGMKPFELALVAAISGLAAVKLADYGLYYFRRAHSFLAHHISDGTILTPSMESMKRNVIKAPL